MELARRMHWSEEEYLAHEELSPTKNEFYQGEIYAMAGARSGHNVVAANVVISLGNLIRLGKRCRAFTSDQRIHIPARGLYTYADGGVACGRLQIHDKDGMSLLNPTLLFEVLSPSTAEYDRGAKLDHYRRIASLQEVLIIDQPTRLVEHHHRVAAGDDEGSWQSDSHREGIVTLDALGGALLVDDIYYLADIDRE